MKQLDSKQAYELAMKYHQKGELAKAEQLYGAVLEVDRHNADAMHYLGLIHIANGKTESALELMKQAVSLDKTNPVFHNNLGEIYRQTGQFEHAEFHLSSAAELKPNYSDAFSNLGLLYKERGLVNDAKYCFAEALQSDPKNLSALINTGNLFNSEGSYEDAIQCYEAALEISPDNPNALASAGAAYYKTGEYNTSAKYYSRLVNGHPELHRDRVNLALITLRNKDFRKGFQLYESRFKYLDVMEGAQEKLWRGTNLKDKTLYVYNEKSGLSGFGDTILFARYILELEKYEPSKVIFRVQPELETLFRENMPENIEVTSESCADYDVHSPLLSLPLVLNARAKTIPHSEGYLKADSKKVQIFSEEMLTEKTKIGIVFQTSKDHTDHEKRSLTQESFSSLYNNSSVKLFHIGKETAETPLDKTVTDMNEKINDFSDTAAIIENLDMVITADTSVAHLAGAMGKKTALLIDHLHDWRWFNAKEGKQSEWYSSVTFHIKEKGSSWFDVVSSINI
ncbi:Tetratricopeptide TPR_2 repeat protein [Denitrovibrio acetiphilus DSM 12809]|uniref:Tetratricopeptide TPR_2 repeat protein n=1 Tax=Denitrovibrio acetiphilus (strain DSM 12809 / NBRC 114555 / N2460) TaxID=522772 RepID=D4H4B9_DENA2|nr:tetratricopeptide repeat protein [Denitrovibrio acetiphilus]ADD69248.1 Tetratricopeptide TPR_2 repeat protein [Denitrovibrio acetiphilus DSM 12809]